LLLSKLANDRDGQRFLAEHGLGRRVYGVAAHRE
jgi:hypothetical protein